MLIIDPSGKDTVNVNDLDNRWATLDTANDHVLLDDNVTVKPTVGQKIKDFFTRKSGYVYTNSSTDSNQGFDIGSENNGYLQGLEIIEDPTSGTGVAGSAKGDGSWLLSTLKGLASAIGIVSDNNPQGSEKSESFISKFNKVQVTGDSVITTFGEPTVRAVYKKGGRKGFSYFGRVPVKEEDYKNLKLLIQNNIMSRICLLFFLFLISCSNKKSINLESYSSQLILLEQTTRGTLWNEVNRRITEDSKDISAILHVLELVDSSLVNLIFETGGYDVETFELIEGMDNEIALLVMKDNNTIAKIDQYLESNLYISDELKMTIKDILFPLYKYNDLNREINATSAAYEMLIVENRLLIEVLRRQEFNASN
jgi:hypothetical protein